MSIFGSDSAGNENYTGIAARDTANALRVLAGAVRGVAAGTKNQQTQEYILSTAQQVGGSRGGTECLSTYIMYSFCCIYIFITPSHHMTIT